MNQTFVSIPIGRTFLRLTDGHKFIKLPRYLDADSEEEYNAICLDYLYAHEALQWFDPEEQVIPIEENL